MINFHRNTSIVGGLLLLCITGPRKYSIARSWQEWRSAAHGWNLRRRARSLRAMRTAL